VGEEEQPDMRSRPLLFARMHRAAGWCFLRADAESRAGVGIPGKNKFLLHRLTMRLRHSSPLLQTETFTNPPIFP
jgi:hypothetical protein